MKYGSSPTSASSPDTCASASCRDARPWSSSGSATIWRICRRGLSAAQVDEGKRDGSDAEGQRDGLEETSRDEAPHQGRPPATMESAQSPVWNGDTPARAGIARPGMIHARSSPIGRVEGIMI
jgi:hypothetical protein